MVNHNSFYNSKSLELVSAKNANNVSIDHLAFAMPLSSLGQLRKLAFRGSDRFLYPKKPKVNNVTFSDFSDFEKTKINQSEQMSEFYFLTLKVFLETVFDFTLSPPRGKGFQGYTDSMTMYTSTGTKAGFVGIGGQNDTVYVQISGFGCKHFLSVTTAKKVHYWLSSVLCVSKLSRLDIAYDCFDNIYNCDFAENAHYEGMFKTRGRPPLIGRATQWEWGEARSKKYTVEMTTIGQRTSPVYWRVYNKKLEQGIDDPNLFWFRSEVELKKWNIDSLLNIEATFSGLCSFASELTDNKGVNTRSITKVSIASLELLARVRHARRTAGKAFFDILDYANGDLSHAFGLLISEKHLNSNSNVNSLGADLFKGSSLALPNTYKQLISNIF